MDEPREKIITLLRPVEFSGGTVTDLRLRPPKISEWRKSQMAALPLDQMLGLVSVVSGVPREALDLMDADQVVEAGDYVLGFLSPGPRTGES